MSKKVLAAVLMVAAASMFAAFATSASATPSRTTRCSNCHTGSNIPVTANLASMSGTNATYNVSAPGASSIAVFNGATKVGSTINSASGQFTVPTGIMYTVYGVGGPSESDGIGRVSVSPVAPVADTIAPVTTSDAKATYVASAVIRLSATDAVGVTATYYTLDSGVQTAGTTINVLTPGPHTIQFWSVDAAGNVEARKSATFTITVPDTVAPVTTSDAKAAYVSSAVIKLSATDAVGVTATYYRLDAAAQTSGTTINVATVGSHTLEFWSIDAAGNVETHKSVTFSITAPVPTGTVSLTISSRASRVHEDRPIRLSGVVTGVDAGAKVSVYTKRTSRSCWTLVSRPTVTVNADGALVWTLKYTPRHEGTYQFQVRFTNADGTVVSKTIKVRVSD